MFADWRSPAKPAVLGRPDAAKCPLLGVYVETGLVYLKTCCERWLILARRKAHLWWC